MNKGLLKRRLPGSGAAKGKRRKGARDALAKAARVAAATALVVAGMPTASLLASPPAYADDGTVPAYQETKSYIAQYSDDGLTSTEGMGDDAVERQMGETDKVVYLKRTLADKRAFDDGTTIDEAFEENQAAVYAMYCDVVHLYDPGEASDCYVADISYGERNGTGVLTDVAANIGLAESGIRTVTDQVGFNCDAGLVYVPKSLYDGVDEITADNVVQVQALYLGSPEGSPTTAVDLEIDNRNRDVTATARRQQVEGDTYDVTTRLPIATPQTASAVSLEDLRVWVNGSETPFLDGEANAALMDEAGLAAYDAETGELVIAESPSSLVSVRVQVTGGSWLGIGRAYADATHVTDPDEMRFLRENTATSSEVSASRAGDIVTLDKLDVSRLREGDKFQYDGYTQWKKTYTGSYLQAKEFTRNYGYVKVASDDELARGTALAIARGDGDWFFSGEGSSTIEEGDHNQSWSKFLVTPPIGFAGVTSKPTQVNYSGEALDNQKGLDFSGWLPTCHSSERKARTYMLNAMCNHSSADLGEAGDNDEDAAEQTRMTILKIEDKPSSGRPYLIVGFTTQEASSGEGAHQAACAIYKVAVENPTGKARLTKEAAGTPGYTAGNGCYDISGARYTLYTDSDCTTAAKDTDGDNAVLTTKADGTTNTVELDAGSYYAKETRVPKRGYKQDTGVHKVKVESGETAEIEATDPPVTAPLKVLLQKANSETGRVNPRSHGTTTNGARYRVSYYKTGDASETTGTPNATAVFETATYGDSEGVLAFAGATPVEGTWKYRTSKGKNYLPLGTVAIEEVSPPAGYQLDTKRLVMTITDASEYDADESDTTVTSKSGNWDGNTATTAATTAHAEHGLYGSIAVLKADLGKASLDAASGNKRGEGSPGTGAEPQGDAALAGAVFHVRNASGGAVTLSDGTSVADGAFLPEKYDFETSWQTVTLADGTKATGYIARSAEGLLPSGTYEVYEKTPPEGYDTGTFGNGRDHLTYTVPTREDTADSGWQQHEVLGSAQVQMEDAVKTGQIAVQKSELETHESGTAVGQADDNGNGNSDDDGTDGSPDSDSASSTGGSSDSNSDSNSSSNSESNSDSGSDVATALADALTALIAPQAHAEEAAEGEARANGELADRARRIAQANAADGAARGDSSQGDGTLAGAVFEVYNSSERSVVVDQSVTAEGVTYAKEGDGLTEYAAGELVETITSVREEAGDGTYRYIARSGDNMPYGTYTVREAAAPEGHKPWTGRDKTVVLHVGATGEVNEQATDAGDLGPFANQVVRYGIAFDKKAEGEGTSRPLAGVAFLVTSNGTGEQHVVVTDENGGFSSDGDAANSHSYETNASDAAVTFADGHALSSTPYHGNEGNARPAESDYTVDPSKLKPTGLWFSRSQDGAWEAPVDDALGALPYDTYTVAELRCEANEGYELVEPFTVTAHATRNGSAADADGRVVDVGTIDDRVAEPEMGTRAADADTGSQAGALDGSGEVTVTDTVEYRNFEEGTYTVHGTLMDARTGRPYLDDDGGKVTGEARLEVTRENRSGTVEVELGPFKGANLGGGTDEGRSVVVYERAVREGSDDGDYASHQDIDDAAQTVHYPGGTTDARDGESGTGTGTADADVTVVDTVTYRNLVVGRAYTVNGTLMDKGTGEPYRDDNGNEVTATAEFTPESQGGERLADGTELADGTVELVFGPFSGANLSGRQAVAFERVADEEGRGVWAHEDIDDDAQTVGYPGISTTASDAEDGDGYAHADDDVTIADRVHYEGLTPGETYTVRGTLMDRATGEALKDAHGTEVTAETELTAPAANGDVVLEFTLDGSSLAGTDAVVFERLYAGEALIASHEDIDDAAQTVRLTDIRTTATDAADGDHEADAGGRVTITDAVEYVGLDEGETYVMVGRLMDKATGAAFEGTEEVSEEFEAAEGGRGTVELSFEVDASDVTSDMATVAFETCYRGEVRKGNRVDEHADLTDADQTVMLKEPAGKEDQPTKTPTRRTATPAKTTVKDRPGIKSPEIMPQTGQGILAVMLVAAGTALIAAALVRARRR